MNLFWWFHPEKAKLRTNHSLFLYIFFYRLPVCFVFAVYWGAGAGVCYIWGAVLMVFPIYILTRVIPAKTQWSSPRCAMPIYPTLRATPKDQVSSHHSKDQVISAQCATPIYPSTKATPFPPITAKTQWSQPMCHAHLPHFKSHTLSSHHCKDPVISANVPGPSTPLQEPHPFLPSYCNISDHGIKLALLELSTD